MSVFNSMTSSLSFKWYGSEHPLGNIIMKCLYPFKGSSFWQEYKTNAFFATHYLPQHTEKNIWRDISEKIIIPNFRSMHRTLTPLPQCSFCTLQEMIKKKNKKKKNNRLSLSSVVLILNADNQSNTKGRFILQYCAIKLWKLDTVQL